MPRGRRSIRYRCFELRVAHDRTDLAVGCAQFIKQRTRLNTDLVQIRAVCQLGHSCQRPLDARGDLWDIDFFDIT